MTARPTPWRRRSVISARISSSIWAYAAAFSRMRCMRIRWTAAASTRPVKVLEISVNASAKDNCPNTTRGRHAFHSTRNASCGSPRASPSDDARVGWTGDSVMSVSKRSRARRTGRNHKESASRAPLEPVVSRSSPCREPISPVLESASNLSCSDLLALSALPETIRKNLPDHLSHVTDTCDQLSPSQSG